MFKPSIELLHSSMASDPGAHEVWQEIVTKSRAALEEAARHLIAARLVQLTVGQLTDHLWFYFGLYAWRSLIDECGWSYDEAERWLLRNALVALDPREPDD